MTGLPVLHDYQEAALESYSAAVRAGFRAPCLILPTGGGKTVTASAAVARAIARGKRVAWFAHRRELVGQAVRTLASYGIEVGYDGFNRDARTQVCSIQTCTRREQVPEADLVVLDEARHYVSDRWFSIYEVYKHVFRMGLDATPERGDGRSVRPMFDHLIVGVTYSDLLALNQKDSTKGLVSCELINPKGYIAARKISLEPDEAYLRYTPGKSAVVFAPNQKSAIHFAQRFNDAGIGATWVTDKLSDDERDARLHAFAEGCHGRRVHGRPITKVICNVQILTEGWDCPGAEVAIVARKPGTAGLWIQMLGRVLRPCVASGKTSAWVLDLVNGSELYGGPETEYTYHLEGTAIRRKGAQPEERFCDCGSILGPNGQCPNPLCTKPASEAFIPEAAGVAMGKFAGLRALPKTKKAVVVARWIAKSLLAKHTNTEGHIRHKYQAVFAEQLTDEMLHYATSISGRFR